MKILSAGAAKGLLYTVAASEGIDLIGEFGAVGAIRERLKAGAPCDVIVLTAAMIAELAASGEVDAASVIALGKVHTGVALLNSAPRASTTPANEEEGDTARDRRRPQDRIGAGHGTTAQEGRGCHRLRARF